MLAVPLLEADPEEDGDAEDPDEVVRVGSAELAPDDPLFVVEVALLLVVEVAVETSPLLEGALKEPESSIDPEGAG